MFKKLVNYFKAAMKNYSTALETFKYISKFV